MQKRADNGTFFIKYTEVNTQMSKSNNIYANL